MRYRFLRVILVCTLLVGCDVFVSADTRVERAEKLIAAHDYRAAAIELRNALQSEGGHMQARLLLSEVSLHLGDVVAADKELRRAIEAGARPDRTAPLAAEVQLALGKPRDVLASIDSDEFVLPEPQRSNYRGEAWLALGESAQAQAAFEAALAADARNGRARLGLAEVHASRGHLDEALREVDAILAADADLPEALLARGMIFARRGQFADAEESLRAARRSSAKLRIRQQAGLLAALGDVQLARRDIKSARESVAQLASISKDSPITLILSARIAMAEQDYSRAATDLQKVVATSPDFVPARFLLGAALLAQGNLGQAEQQLREVLQRAPANLEARKLLAQVQLRLERPDAAMEVLLPAVQADGSDGSISALLGFVQLQLGDETKGLELLKRSVADNPQNRGLKFELATALVRSGHDPEAILLMRNLEHVAGDVRRERILLAAIATDQGLAAARSEAEALVTAYPNEGGVLGLAGTFLATQGDFERARVLLGQAAHVMPNDATTMIGAAVVELSAGDANAASQWLERALQAEPKNSTARMLLAEIALRRNDPQVAAQWLEGARKLDPSAVQPRLRLARLHLSERRNEEADKVINEVIAAAGPRADILNAIGMIDLDGGRHHEALARFRRATEIAPEEPSYWLNVAHAQLALSDGAAARETLLKTLSLRANWVPAVSALAMLDVSEGKSAQALSRIAELKRASPRNAAVLVIEGDVNMAAKRYVEASHSFDEAWALQATAQTAVKSHRARQLGKLGDATQLLEAWLKRKPDDLAPRLVLAESYVVSGQHIRAIEQYELLTSQQPRNAGALNNLAWLYQQEGDARAEATARRAFEAAPGVAAVADTYGWILVRSGRAAEGLAVLQEASARGKGNPEIDYHYASALAETGASEDARKLLTAALSRPEPFASRAHAQQLLERLPSS